MFGAIAGGIASALAGGAMSKLFGGGQKAASGGIQGDVLATDNNLDMAPPARAEAIPPAIARSEERFSRNAETDLVCRLLLEKKKCRRDRTSPRSTSTRAASRRCIAFSGPRVSSRTTVS